MRRKLSDALITQIRMRAGGLCEYCHVIEQWQCVLFTVDHVIPLALGGDDTITNLALACAHCNRRKSYSITSIDPQTNLSTSLFNPRLDQWRDHFIWSGDSTKLIGTTPSGRATITTLEINRPHLVSIRQADIVIGRHPPEGDLRLFS